MKPDVLISLNILEAKKSDNRNTAVDTSNPVKATKNITEKNPSLNFFLSFSEERNLTTPIDKPIRARGDKRDTVIFICAQIP